ncbi:hypothetical protein HPB47_016409 [Ixodes persulcatus]|uniref:Uncharacterized protein n=1 Tax=Ixodes persulcatus TaxID=34615 RepID=A0AC60R2F7_IXOPE|nr:hypothetical protein HPB47_016409 [Ixodes persulcatus]
MENGRSTGSLIMKIAQRTESGLERALCQLGDIAGTAAALADLPPQQEHPQPMDIDLHIPGLRSRRTATTVTLGILALSHIEDQYHGWAQVFTDGSVRLTDGSSTAAAAFEVAGVGLSARLTHHATSTTFELAVILLALEAVQKGSTRGGKWVILRDSQAALSMLDNLERAPPLAQRIAAEAMALKQFGHQFRFQWLPSHCGIKGNEIADQMANFAHDEPSTLIFKVPASADAKLLVAREIASQHPDARMAQGDHPARLPARMNRATAAVFHRLRTGSALTPAWINRMRASRSPGCNTCGTRADDAHLLLQCTLSDTERRALQEEYKKRNLPYSSLEEIIRPRGTNCTKKKALKALENYLDETGLMSLL